MSPSGSKFSDVTDAPHERPHVVVFLARFFDVFVGFQVTWTPPSASSDLTMYIATFWETQNTENQTNRPVQKTKHVLAVFFQFVSVSGYSNIDFVWGMYPSTNLILEISPRAFERNPNHLLGRNSRR